jgi:hypothetical protein
MLVLTMMLRRRMVPVVTYAAASVALAIRSDCAFQRAILAGALAEGRNGLCPGVIQWTAIGGVIVTSRVTP